jgi:hypothetical protein
MGGIICVFRHAKTSSPNFKQIVASYLSVFYLLTIKLANLYLGNKSH